MNEESNKESQKTKQITTIKKNMKTSTLFLSEPLLELHLSRRRILSNLFFAMRSLKITEHQYFTRPCYENNFADRTGEEYTRLNDPVQNAHRGTEINLESSVRMPHFVLYRNL